MKSNFQEQVLVLCRDFREDVITMKRNLRYQAIVMKNYRIGEFHKGVVLCTREAGIIHAVAHGGYKGKSRLSSKTDVLNQIEAYVYHDPVKNSFKITDAVGLKYFEKLKAGLKRVFTASLACEIVISSYGGGDSFLSVYHLLLQCLTLLDNEEPEREDFTIIQFIWRYIRILGVQPALDICSKCGRGFEKKDDLYYSVSDGDSLCHQCGNENELRIPSGGRAYLSYTEDLSFEKAVKVGLEKITRKTLKTVLIRIIEDVLDTRFNTVEAGGGVL